MKKIFYMIAAALAISGCSQDNLDESTEINVTGKSSLTAKIVPPTSRLNIDGFKITWSANDKLVAFDEYVSESSAYVLTEGVGTGVGGFAALETEVADPWYAVYPSSVLPSAAQDELHVTLPQAYDTSASSENLPLFGNIDEYGIVNFSYMTAVLKVNFQNLPEGFTTLMFESKGTPISGEFNIQGYDAFNNPKTLSPIKEKGHFSVKVTHAQANGIYYLPIPAATYEQLLVTAMDENGKTIHLVSLWEKTFELGKVYEVSERKYQANIVTEPLIVGDVHPADDTIAGWTMKKNYAKHGTYELIENTDPSLIWSKSIKWSVTSTDPKFNWGWFNMMYTYRPEQPLNVNKKYKLSLKFKGSGKLGVKVVSFDPTAKGEGKYSFAICTNPNSKQGWQRFQSPDEMKEFFVYFDLSNYGNVGGGNPSKWESTEQNPELLKTFSILLMPDNKVAEYYISDIQVSEVVY